MKAPEYLVIITGLSGSGKSYVQSTLEDLGFYCSDNLPVALIPTFADLASSRGAVTRASTRDAASSTVTFSPCLIATAATSRPTYPPPTMASLAPATKRGRMRSTSAIVRR